MTRSNIFDNNDSYHFFQQAGGLIKTGATQTNVMDIMLALIR
jgi:glycerate 2-kinase